MQNRHAVRLSKVSREPGVFVYDGEALDSVYTPTPMVTGKNVPVLDANGFPVMDGSGRQVFERAGKVVRNEDGTPKLGGKPKVEYQKMPYRVVGGVRFDAGNPVAVDSPDLAQKLRCLSHFQEVKEDAADMNTLEGLLTLNKAELVKLANGKGITIEKNHTKQQIAEAILERD